LLKFNAKIPSNKPGIDHNSLLNRGTRTHEELDDLYTEVSASRGTFSSLAIRIQNIISSIISDHTKLSNIGIKTHGELDTLWQEVDDAKDNGAGGKYDTLKEKMDSIKPVVKFTELADVDNTSLKDKYPFVWDDTNKKVIQIAFPSGGGTGGGTTLPDDYVQAVEKRLKNLEQQEVLFNKTIIQMQFKYDIALNLAKNQCSDYFIDVLQDSSNIESMIDCSYNGITETIS
jgi:hypothetical protein